MKIKKVIFRLEDTVYKNLKTSSFKNFNKSSYCLTDKNNEFTLELGEEIFYSAYGAEIVITLSILNKNNKELIYINDIGVGYLYKLFQFFIVKENEQIYIFKIEIDNKNDLSEYDSMYIKESIQKNSKFIKNLLLFYDAGNRYEFARILYGYLCLNNSKKKIYKNEILDLICYYGYDLLEERLSNSSSEKAFCSMIECVSSDKELQDIEVHDKLFEELFRHIQD